MELKLFCPGEPVVLFPERPGLTVVTEWRCGGCRGALARLEPPRRGHPNRLFFRQELGNLWRPRSGQRSGLRHFTVTRAGVYEADSAHDSITDLRTFFELHSDGKVEVLYQARLPVGRGGFERALRRAREVWAAGKKVEEGESLKA